MKGCRLIALAAIGLGLIATPQARAGGSGAVSAASLVRPGDLVFGNPHGKVTIVDFYDIRCPPCRHMDRRFKRLLRHDHDVRYVPVAYPILGPASVLGTEAMFAAGAQGKLIPFRARLMTQKRPPINAILKTDAKALGLDWRRMEFAMNGDGVIHRIQANLRRGRSLGIHEIPTLFINNTKIVGSVSYADLVSLVHAARKTAEAAARGAASSPSSTHGT
ncbi:DsbA family protein [Acidiphilium iwatense]|uniref:Thioredoxin domain-containing protein n=1 Tax=Acidiphilium iwatense TaxID=768198 RepID=A0ABS9DZ33_9PROT|nr:thioredoxin domain-containing protein [Acidiphilium iwatense]MCF3947949.1 thioredoxin domain-containing protein [Acidiphilium iwatense]